MTTPKFCSLCGQPLQGRAASFKRQADDERGLTVCTDCLRTAPRCPICHTPMRSDLVGICPACQAELPPCSSCGQMITGRYLKIEERGIFCETCFESRPACASCGSPVGQDGQALPDGRHLCPVCHRTAVFDQSAARAVFEQVKGIIGQELGLALNVPTPIYLADRQQLKATAERLGETLEPMPVDQSLGFYLRQGRRRGIYVLSGLPRTLLTSVLAHEYAHAWQAEHNPVGGELLLWEGFAEWVAYKTIAYLGQTAMMRQMQAQSNIYGQGLRQMLEIERERGIAGVLTVAQRKRRIGTMKDKKRDP